MKKKIWKVGQNCWYLYVEDPKTWKTLDKTPGIKKMGEYRDLNGRIIGIQYRLNEEGFNHYHNPKTKCVQGTLF